MLRIALLIFAASTLSAQFSDFAVTDDGRLYFSTQLNTGDGDNRSKIYRITGDGLSTSASPTDNDPFGPSPILPLTSGDGSITGYSVYYPCRTGSCGLSGIPRTVVQLQGAELSTTFNTLQISRNGRYLFGTSFGSGIVLLELPSQNKRQFPNIVPAGDQAVTNAGLVLLRDYRFIGPTFYAPLNGDPVPIPGTDLSTTGIVSPDGSRVAYERSAGDGYELVLTDLQGSSHQVLAYSPVRLVFKPSFANDGTLLYLDGAGQPNLVTPSGESRPFLALTAREAIISGNSQLVWLGTTSGQILRVRTSDGVADEIVPETPLVTSNFASAYPGSLIRLTGISFTPRTRFRLGEIVLPLSEVNSTEAAVQIPWEYDVQNGSRTLAVDGPESPFHQRFTFTPLTQPMINFERSLSNGTLQAAHQDFRGIVSKEDPAVPGETIHIFARNMGPVDQTVATGQRSPTSPPARVTTPMACYLSKPDASGNFSNAQALVIPFAGLSGGSVGVYQIDVTIPADFGSTLGYIVCRMGDLQDNNRIDIAPIP